ncbi:hypothetical protein Tco_0698088 [Tanacetum coccineum]
MAVLESCHKHNMVAYLEKTDGNTEFHEIINFLMRSSIHYALNVSPVVSTTFVEQFWMSAKSKLINNVRYITAKVAGKPASISEASIRSDILFNDVDGIDYLPNQAIFDAIQLMRVDQHETQTDPSPRPSPTSHITDSIPEGFGGNHGGQSSSDRSLSGNEGGMTLQSEYDLDISFEKIHEETWNAKWSLYPNREDTAKLNLQFHKESSFDDSDMMQLTIFGDRDAQDVGRTRYVVHEEKKSAEKEVSTEDALGTDKQKVSTDKEEVSTDRPDEGTDKQKVSTDKEEVSTDRPDEGTIQNKEKLKEKEKGVELKDVEETERPRPTSTRSLLTLKPLPKIDPKDKGKKKIEEEDESDTESEGITEAEKKFKQLARDEEVARKVQEDWEAEEEVKKLAEEEATKAALSNEYDFIQARLNADKILAEKLQEEEREINKPPSRNQLRNQMMTYLKHVGGKKHFDLKTKSFEEIKALYDKIKMSDDSFIAIGYAEDEKEIVTWRLYEACGVCILEFKDGTVIHMLVERKYPLSKELLQRMLDFGLEVEVESTAALDLIRVLNSPCFMVKSWLVQDQTVLGKDYSNLLIADSLLKTIWFINAPCYGNEALASPKANGLTIPEQTATGKGISNPFMAGSLPKTTKPT